MNDQEHIGLVMREIGPRDDGILEILQTGDESWAMRFQDVDVEIELEPESRRLMLSAEIGAPNDEQRASFYEAMLLFNLLWRDTGGVRMGLAEAGGAILQMVDLHCSSVTTDMLVAVARNLNDRTLLWRDFLKAPPPNELATESSANHPMIQV